MTIDIFDFAGTKKGTMELPEELFAAHINQALMHQAVVRQQSNRRTPIAHVKHRGEVRGSTKKVYAQKHTGQARRGSVRSPLLRGGGKSFGPRNTANFVKDMPKSMRRVALCSCLSLQAKQGAIIGLESYPDAIKTKDANALLKKLPLEYGRRILVVTPEPQKSLVLSLRNIPFVKIVTAAYLNPEDILNARRIIFLAGAVEKAQQIFGRKQREIKVRVTAPAKVEAGKKPVKKATTKKKPATKKTAAPKASRTK